MASSMARLVSLTTSKWLNRDFILRIFDQSYRKLKGAGQEWREDDSHFAPRADQHRCADHRQRIAECLDATAGERRELKLDSDLSRHPSKSSSTAHLSKIVDRTID
jgi:hypothetical protein